MWWGDQLNSGEQRGKNTRLINITNSKKKEELSNLTTWREYEEGMKHKMFHSWNIHSGKLNLLTTKSKNTFLKQTLEQSVPKAIGIWHILAEWKCTYLVIWLCFLFINFIYMKLNEMRREVISNAKDIAASGIEMNKKTTSIVYCPFCDFLKHQTEHCKYKQ